MRTRFKVNTSTYSASEVADALCAPPEVSATVVASVGGVAIIDADGEESARALRRGMERDARVLAYHVLEVRS